MGVGGSCLPARGVSFREAFEAALQMAGGGRTQARWGLRSPSCSQRLCPSGFPCSPCEELMGDAGSQRSCGSVGRAEQSSHSPSSESHLCSE